MKKLFIAAMAMLALAGCKQAQSELDFENVEANATIKGNVVAYQDKTNFDTNVKSMDGIRIYFEVAASQFVTGATGTKQFEAITDSLGNFTITVPTGAKTITGKLKTDDIQSTQDEKVVYYEAYTGANISLNAGDVRIESIKLVKDELLSECIGEAYIYGTVTYDGGYQAMEDKSHEWSYIPCKNALMTATVNYASGERTKTFITFTDDNGAYSFQIPVEDNGNNIAISGAEFDAEYVDWLNNQSVSRMYHYTFTPVVKTGVKAAQDIRVDMEANKSSKPIDEVTTKNRTVKVSGKILKKYEKITYNKDEHATGVEMGTKPYVGKAYVNVFDDSTDRDIYYDITTNEKGEYEYEAKLPDDWDLTSGNIYVYVGTLEAFVEKDFKHYYLGFATKEKDDKDLWYEKITSWYGKFGDMDEAANCYSTQKLNVVYDDDYIYTMLSSNAIFFDVKMTDLELGCEPEDKTIVLGVGNACDFEDRPTYTSPDADQHVKVASNGLKFWTL